MAIQSRARSTRRSGDLVQQQAPSAKAAAGAAQEAPPQHTNPTPHHPLPPRPHPASPPASDDYEPDSRPTKKRKLSIRSKSTQTTLDHHFFPHQSQPPKPTTTQVVVTQTRAPLLPPLNGVRTLVQLDDDDDELASGVATLKSNKRPKTPVQGPRETSGKQEEKRTLRSQDEGPRLKSDLAIYFPNYEDIIFDAPREEELINCDTVLYITDDAAKQVKSEQQLSPAAKSGKSVKGSASSGRNGSLTNGSTSATTTPQRSNSTHLNGSPSLNLDTISRTIPANPPDPLTDDYYLKSHNRAERKEKQLRNIEKERAMHEKVQLDRLLDGLQGHDWLKVLGITGITDGEARKYEEKRDYFIAEVQALVDKFRAWKEQEKKQRLDKEAAQAAREEEEEEDEDADDSDAADSTAPPSSDLNASAARQLQQETASALKSSKHLPRLKLKLKPPSSSASTPRTPHPPPPPRLSPEVPITSFYAKRHLRDAALGKARHGRNVLAFGQPVPEMQEREFELPEEYVTAEVVRANAREKRRRRREGLGEGGVGG